MGTVKGFEAADDDMSVHYLSGDPPVSLTLRRSARARRISLRVSQLDGRVTLTLPSGLPEDEALDFARGREDWIRAHLAKRIDDVIVQADVDIPVEGVLHRITEATGKRIILGDGSLHVPAPLSAARVSGWLKTLARERLAGACDQYEKSLGKRYTRITLRDTRSRWGSCSSAGALMFSWRLIMAPPSVLSYVAAHEVAHLAEMNHSPAFWSTVERLYGSYEVPRRWLRDHGNTLHRYRF